MILSKNANNKGADQTVRMGRLVCTFDVCKPPKTGFLTSRPKYCMLIEEQFVQGRDCLPVNRLVLTLCMLGNLTFFKMNFFNNFVQEYYQRFTPYGSRSGFTFCHS